MRPSRSQTKRTSTIVLMISFAASDGVIGTRS
jgi:preprotein translocase subunit SecE